MGSTLYRITVAGVEDATPHLRFQVINSQGQQVPAPAKNVALQAIVEAYWYPKMGYLFDEQPADKDRLKKVAESSPKTGLLEELREHMHGRQVPISPDQYQALSETPYPEGIVGTGMEGDECFLMYRPNYNALCEAADRMIVSVSKRDERKDENHSAELCCKVADPSLLAHLTPGLRWESALFDIEDHDLRTVWIDETAPAIPDLSMATTSFRPFDGEASAGTPSRCQFSPDGATLFVSSQASELVAYETATWRELWRHRPGDGLFAEEIAVDVQQVHLFDGYMEAETSLTFSLSGDPLQPNKPRARLTSPKGTYAVNYGIEDVGLRFADDARLLETAGTVEAAAFSSDESLLAVGGTFSGFVIADPATCKVVSKIETSGPCKDVAFSPDARLIAACIDHHRVEIYRVSDGKRLVRQRESDYLVRARWSPDGEHFIVLHVGAQHGYGGSIRRYQA